MEQKLCLQVECLKNPKSKIDLKIPNFDHMVAPKCFSKITFLPFYIVAFTVFFHLSHIISKSYRAFFIL